MMTGMTVDSRAAGLAPAVSAVPNAKGMTEKTQDFSAILNKTAQKAEQPKETGRNMDLAAQKKPSGTKQPSEAKEPDGKDQIVEDRIAERVDETGECREDVAGDAVSAKDQVDGTAAERVDEVAEAVAGALSQIIEQIKEILGVTDEELLGTMERIDMQLFDLLDPANMTQLVTALAGEDSAISLVADEGLYTALQDIMDVVGTQVEDLLQETGLTAEELDSVLQKLAEMGSGQETGDPEAVQAPLEDSQDAADRQGALVYDVAEESQEQVAKEPVVIREDKTQQQVLPENQQSGQAEENAKIPAQRTGQDAESGKHQDDEPRDFGQQQDFFQNELNGAVRTAGENVQSFTSESTESIMRQIADMVRIVRNEDLTEMEMQLHPASLGTVNVSLSTKGGVVTAEFTTQNEAVKAAIEAQASQLKANLEEQGIKIEAIEVSVASHQMEKNLDGNGQGQQQGAREQKAGRIQGVRRNSIDLKAFEDGDALVEEMQGVDDATRIAMEMMAANGNSMDLFV